MLLSLLLGCASHAPADPVVAMTQEAPGCAPLADQQTAVTWQGADHTVLLRADLGGDPRQELVVEQANSCGTGGCTALVLTACGGDVDHRAVGELEHWDGVTAAPDGNQGWLDLVAGVKSFDADGQPVSAHRVYSWNGSIYAPQ